MHSSLPRITFSLSVLCALASQCSSLQANQTLQHAITLYGEPKYPAHFSHFDYTNPLAPKGGELKQAAIGSYDSLNPYIDKGTAAAGSRLLHATLLTRAWDEPLTKYGNIAWRIEQDPDNHWVAFHIDRRARFHDGHPITANDVKFSFTLLKTQGSTFYKSFYKDIAEVEVTSPYRVVFHFSHNQNRELALILGQMPVLPEHYWRSRHFSSSGLEPPVGSGPYKVSAIDPGRSISYERVKDYWGANLPVNKGRFNFDRLTYEYYRDNTVSLQALIAGEYDFKLIDNPRIWHTQTAPDTLTKTGWVRRLFNNKNPQTLTLTYNTRRPVLQSRPVREALGYAFDFDTINRQQFYSMYQRAASYFAGTALAATGTPTAGEQALLKPWQPTLPTALFTEPYQTPGAEAPAMMSPRAKKKKALALLASAGWKPTSRGLIKDGKQLELEALVMLPEHEKVLLFFQQGLEKLGIKLHVRQVDSAQYVERLRSQDFDIVVHVFRHTPSPGTEQASFWGSAAINQHGSRNLAGANLPVLDALTASLGNVKTFAELQNNVKAMDRVLLWQQYTLPLWYLPVWPVVHKNTLHSPKKPAPYALDLMTWWYQPKY